MTAQAAWTAIAINGSASHPSSHVQVVAQTPDGRLAGLLRLDVEDIHLENQVTVDELDELAAAKRIRRLAEAVPVDRACGALVLRPELRDALDQYLFSQEPRWPEEVRVTRLEGEADVEVGIGADTVLRALRRRWARALERAADAAGERYAVALAGAERGAAEEQALQEMQDMARLGTYCVDAADGYPFRLRIAFTQAYLADVIGLQRTYELAVRRQCGVSLETMERDIRELYRLYVGRAEAQLLSQQRLSQEARGAMAVQGKTRDLAWTSGPRVEARGPKMYRVKVKAAAKARIKSWSRARRMTAATTTPKASTGTG